MFGRPELYEQRGELRLRALTIERVGLGAHLAALERLKRTLAAEGLFDVTRKRPLPRFPRLIGLVTGNDAAAKRDVLTQVVQRFPPANVVVAETYVQGPRAPAAIVAAIGELCRRGVDVLVLARGGGSFEDLLPFSDERVVRAVAACTVPVVSAVGHEQDTPLCDLAADVRASTPTAAARLVVPDAAELRASLDALARRASPRCARSRPSVTRNGWRRSRERLGRAPLLALERRRSRLDTAHARLVALGAAGDARSRLRDRAPRGRGRALTGRRRDGRRRSTSSSPTGASAQRSNDRQPDVRGGPARAGGDRGAARARRRRRRRADEALGARRGAVPDLRWRSSTASAGGSKSCHERARASSSPSVARSSAAREGSPESGWASKPGATRPPNSSQRTPSRPQLREHGARAPCLRTSSRRPCPRR